MDIPATVHLRQARSRSSIPEGEGRCAISLTGAGINTTVEDLVKWNLALDEEKVLKQATLDQMWAAVRLVGGQVFRFEGTMGCAHGWVLDDRPGHKSVGHSGGGSTAYWRFLDDKLTVIVLTNVQGSDPDSLPRAWPRSTSRSLHREEISVARGRQILQCPEPAPDP